MSDDDDREPPCPPNKFGITDTALLNRVEAFIASVRSGEILTGAKSLPARQGPERLTAIHRHLFGAVYEHGGRFRTGPSYKARVVGQAAGTAFTAPARIKAELDATFADLRQAKSLRGLNRLDFVDEAAKLLARLNQTHAFEDGNGRTLRVFMRMTALAAGHDLPFEGITNDRMVEASYRASHGNLEPLRELLDEQSDPTRLPALIRAHHFLQKDWQGLHDFTLATTVPGRHYAGEYLTGEGAHFLLLDRKAGAVYVGNTADLDVAPQGKGIEHVSFTARRTGLQAAQHWYDTQERAAQRGDTHAHLQGALRKLPANAPNAAQIHAIAADRLKVAARRDAVAQGRLRIVGLQAPALPSR